MIRLIACDLDETLLDDTHRCSQKNKEMIHYAVARGIKFVPATGRGYQSIEPTLQELQLSQEPGQYVISYNGGILTENKDHKILEMHTLTYAQVEALFQKGKEFNVCIQIYTTKQLYIYALNESEKQRLDGFASYECFDGEDLTWLKGTRILKVLYMNEDIAYLNSLAPQLGSLQEELDISYSSNRYMEFNPKCVSKGAGLQNLMSLLGIQREEVIAIGDNWNDLSMIQVAGIGIGVANTIEEMKPYCDRITKASYREDAIAEVIETYVFQEQEERK